MYNRIAIMQPYLFPYIGYFQLINIVDFYIFLDDVQWITRGWINRHTINNNSQEEKITLSVKKHSSRAMINEVLIADSAKEEYLKKLAIIYKKAPYFDDIFQFISALINSNFNNMSELAEHCVKATSKLLDIQTTFERSTHLNNNKNLRGQDKIIDICKIVGTKTYINNINGQHLYDKNIFNDNNIELLFFEKEVTPYKQFNDSFLPYLSIIDVLMFNKIDTVKQMIKKGTLI